jgi:hypothetical protein
MLPILNAIAGHRKGRQGEDKGPGQGGQKAKDEGDKGGNVRCRGLMVGSMTRGGRSNRAYIVSSR